MVLVMVDSSLGLTVDFMGKPSKSLCLSSLFTATNCSVVKPSTAPCFDPFAEMQDPEMHHLGQAFMADDGALARDVTGQADLEKCTEFRAAWRVAAGMG